ncbi:type 1 fimbrial major subunit FimA [Proteus mirabilis]|uniref:type 1 fimbrial major subunit FimA n=1 Tax=Proteus mirabilis TaxID=584 RepID=UPI0039B675E5
MKNNFLAVSLVMACATPLFAMAETPATPADPIIVQGGTVNFVGKLTNAACAVETDSQNQTVKLGDYRTAAFKKIGDSSTPVPFQINLVDCDPNMAENASISFYGQQDSESPDLLAVSAGGSNAISATGVGIEIMDSQQLVVIPDGNAFSNPINLLEGNNTLKFSARYVATKSEVTAGQANASATFNVRYE